MASFVLMANFIFQSLKILVLRRITKQNWTSGMSRDFKGCFCNCLVLCSFNKPCFLYTVIGPEVNCCFCFCKQKLALQAMTFCLHCTECNFVFFAFQSLWLRWLGSAVENPSPGCGPGASVWIKASFSWSDWWISEPPQTHNTGRWEKFISELVARMPGPGLQIALNFFWRWFAAHRSQQHSFRMY